MKVYRFDYGDESEGTVVEWYASMREAADAMRKHAAEHGLDSGAIEAAVRSVEIPSAKPELLKWLNANFDRDNG